MIKYIFTFFGLVIISVIVYLIILGDNQDLGDDYYYLPDYEAEDIGYPGGAIVYKARKKYLFNDIKISGNVTDVNSNRNFVIAIQNPIPSSIMQDIVPTSMQEPDNVEENDSLLGSIWFYIIHKETDEVFGPYSKKEYLQKRKELKIPENLKLENEKLPE